MEEICKQIYSFLLIVCIGLLFLFPLIFNHVIIHEHNEPINKHSDLSCHLEHSISTYTLNFILLNNSNRILDHPFCCVDHLSLFDVKFDNNFMSSFWHPPKHV